MSECTVTRSQPQLHRRARALVAWGLVWAASGCGAEGGGREGGGSGAGGKGDNLGETDGESTGADDGGVTADHRAEVLHCDMLASRLREHTSLARVDAIVALERERNDCLVSANDGAVVVVESVLTAAGDPYAGGGLAAWKDHRNAALVACNAMVEAHVDAASDARRSVAATCVGDFEAQLGAILDAHVDFGAVPHAIPAARDRYDDCYLAHDDELANAPGVDAILEAAAADTTLAACIRDVHDGVVGELAARVVASFPGRDVEAVESELRGAAAALRSAREQVCEIAVRAGPDRAAGGFVATAAECAVDAAILAGAAFDLVAPGVVPGGPGEGGTGTTDDGGSGDTTG